MTGGNLQALLDGLDRRVALGEIDIGTYRALREKFSAEASRSIDPITEAVAGLGKVARAIKCPGCMAPLPPPADPTATRVSCEFCGGTFALQTAVDEMDRLRSDIRAWVAELAGGLGSSGAVDEASRRFIFKDKLLPSLELATNRATESFSHVRHDALFFFPLVKEVPESPFLRAVRMAPGPSRLAASVKVTEARTDSPDILAFAIGESDRNSLKLLQLQCQEVVRLAAVREHLLAFESEGLTKAGANVAALRELYQQIERSCLDNPARAAFARGLAQRMSALGGAIKQLAILYCDADGVMTGSIVAALDSAAAECLLAAMALEASGVEARESFPAVEGARFDAEGITALADSVRLFGMCGAEIGFRFKEFLDSLGAVVKELRASDASMGWLRSFVENLSRHVAALAGEPAVSVVTDYSALESAAAADIHSSILGGRETIENSRLAVPFWVASLSFSEQSGVLFKKGHANEELVFLDASRSKGSWFRSPMNSDVGRKTLSAFEFPAPLNRATRPVIPTLRSEDARGLIKAIGATIPGCIGGQVKVLGLVYLPVLQTIYSAKKNRRERVFLPSLAQAPVTLTTRDVVLGTVRLCLHN